MKTNLVPQALLLSAVGLIALGWACAEPTSGDAERMKKLDAGPKTIDVSKYPADQQKAYKLFEEKCSACHTVARGMDVRVPDVRPCWPGLLSNLTLSPIGRRALFRNRSVPSRRESLPLGPRKRATLLSFVQADAGGSCISRTLARVWRVLLCALRRWASDFPGFQRPAEAKKSALPRRHRRRRTALRLRCGGASADGSRCAEPASRPKSN